MKKNLLLLVITCLFVAGNIFSQTASTNLKLWWKLNDPAGVSQITDFSGSGLHGVPYNAGDAILSGVQDAVRVSVVKFVASATNRIKMNASNTVASGSAARSIAIWFKLNAATNGGAQMILTGSEATGNKLLIAFNNNTKEIKLHFSPSAADNVNFVQPLTAVDKRDGNWHHLVVTVPEGASVAGIKCYVDNVAYFGTITGTLTTLNTTTDPLVLGHYNYTGEVSDLRIYNKELSVAEVGSIYNENPTLTTIDNGATDSKVSLFFNSDYLIVKGIQNSSLINIYNINGQLVKTQTIESSDASIALGRGSYIVKIGSKVFKVIK